MEDYLGPERFSTPGFGLVKQGRRFACDRCRAHKLRCERVFWALEPVACRRCQRAKASCTITSRTPFARRKRCFQEPSMAATPSKSAVGNTTNINLKRPPSVKTDLNASVASHQALPCSIVSDVPDIKEFSPLSHYKGMGSEVSALTGGVCEEDLLVTFNQQVPIDKISGLITPPSTDNGYEMDLSSLNSNTSVRPELESVDSDTHNEFLSHGKANFRTASSGYNEAISNPYQVSSNMEKQLILLNLNCELIRALGGETKPLEPEAFFHPASHTENSGDYLIALYSSVQHVIRLSGSFLSILQAERVPNQRTAGARPSTSLLMVNSYLNLITLCEKTLFEALDHLIMSPRSETQLTPLTLEPSLEAHAFNLKQALEKELADDLRRLVFNLGEIEKRLNLPEKHCVVSAGAPEGLQSNAAWAFILEFFSSQSMNSSSETQRTENQSLRNIILAIQQLL